jgi:putative ABC transport system permease protein
MARWTSDIVGQGMKLAGAGLLVGTLAAFGASRLLAKMLYGVKPGDPPTYASVDGVLGTIALLACYLPARHAGRPCHRSTAGVGASG